MKKLGAVFDAVLDFTARLGGGLIGLSFALITLMVLIRYFFNISILWPVETTEYILVTITFLGAAWVLKKERHTCIDTVISLFKTRQQAFISALVSLACAGLCFVLFYNGLLATLDHFSRGTYQVRIMRLPTWPLLSALPLGFALLTLQFLRRSYQFFAISMRKQAAGETQLIKNEELV